MVWPCYVRGLTKMYFKEFKEGPFKSPEEDFLNKLEYIQFAKNLPI